MPTKFDEAFAKVQKLAAIFESGKEHYLSGDYQEADVRKDFIDKFFIALGWDVNHDEQTNPYAQEVRVERIVNEGSAKKRADYAFSLAPGFKTVRFYVEAKRPSRDFGSTDNCFQAIRYGHFTKKTSPFSVLTSFEDFYILDCRLKPDINDTLSRVVERFSYTDYIDSEKFARIYWLFSREAVTGGSLEKYAEDRPICRGKKFQRGLFKGGDKEPDEEFLGELDGYRQQLAQAFKRANPNLDGGTLTEVTQRTLDRLVFTRFLEDKGIEAPVIENFGKADSFWEDFIAASLRLDRKYNGVVFKFHPLLDAPGFKPDEKVFARICEELTDPTSPYDFNIIPIHILGNIYERFLGKVISDGAQVWDKPEVRKAGGVFYTPEFIVRYIVENTVGKMIEGRTPDEVSKLKFADIACGSGSFLLGVYDLLLKYHAEYYSKNPGKIRKGDCVRRDGLLHLSLQKKRDILTNNIFGVDIDRQAVEVAQLSLYLKLLEDETIGTTSEFQDEFHFTLLPSLDKNIVCGNSLIGPEIADGGVLADDVEKKINPLDYAQRFPAIFRRKVSGGELREAPSGDIPHNVPGGAPLHGSFNYKKSKAAKPSLQKVEAEFEGGFDAVVGNPPYIFGEFINPDEKTYFQSRYVVGDGQLDLYHLFYERALQLVKPDGWHGYIIPDAVLARDETKRIRKLLLQENSVTAICHAGTVFGKVGVSAAVIIAQRRKALPDGRVTIDAVDKNTVVATGRQTALSGFLASPTLAFAIETGDDEQALVKKIRAANSTLGDFCTFSRGEELGKKHFQRMQTLKSGFVWILVGEDIQRYHCTRPEFQIRKGDVKKSYEHYQAPKLVIVKTGKRPVATLETEGLVTMQSVYNGQFVPGQPYRPEFFLAIVNSSLMAWFLRKTVTAYKKLFPQFNQNHFAGLPLPDLRRALSSGKHDRLVAQVEQLLAAKPKLAAAQTERNREFYENKFATLDQEIDRLVFELYGLTEAEIKLVENAD